MSLNPSELAAELLSLESQVRALRLRVEAATGSEASRVSEPSPSSIRPSPWTAEWVEQLRQAVTPEALLALDLSPLRSLSASGQLGSAPPNWTGTSRLARAFRAGVLAQQRLETGDFHLPPSTEYYGPTRFHIVLFCPEKPAGFWSSHSRPFFNLIGDPTEKGLGPNPPHSVFASFSSNQEISAFLLGAQRAEWPEEL